MNGEVAPLVDHVLPPEEVPMRQWVRYGIKKIEVDPDVEANKHLGDQLVIPKAEVPDLPLLKLSLHGVWMEKRSEHRKKRRSCKGRKTWTTYRKIPGARYLLQN